jgi:hypothetical protein
MANTQKVRTPAKAWIHLSEGLVGIGLGAAIALGIYFALLKLQANFCEPDAFLSGPTQLAEFALVLPWFIIVPPLGIVLAMQAGILTRRALGVSAKPLPRNLTPRRSAKYRAASWAVAGVFVTLALISLAALPSYFCAAASGVTLREAIWTDQKEYRWDDVRDVVTKCERSGRSQRSSFVLVTMDGNRIDLATNKGAFVAAYPQVAQALHGRNFTFLAISPESCPSHLKAIFATHP